ncbi:hypothetical protein EDB84DRAFT_1561014 [Lactarius hengduanensis]|nr:hypothetical protein EDB84DRAFT_1561014 [Lactarius hengduanensis]
MTIKRDASRFDQGGSGPWFRDPHHHDKTSVHQHADRVTLQRCWEHALRLLHLRHRAPRSLSLVSLNDSTRSRINLNLIPTSPAHFPGIQAPRPEPATTHLARKSGRGEGDTNIDGSSSDEDDFDGGLDTRVWNRTAALPHALPPPPPPPPPPHPTSRTPALAVSLTYLPAITLLASPLLVSVGMRMGLSLVVTRLSGLSPPASLLSQLRDDNGDEATVTTATMVTRRRRRQRGASNNNPDSDNDPNGDDDDN